MNADEAVRDFWANRPRRALTDRKIAGVAAGIGHRYAVDPTLIRVVFAVLTFYGGAGLLLYVLGWVLLPTDDGRASGFDGMIGRGRSAMSTALTVLLCLALIPISGWVFHGVDGLVALLLGLGALYLLHRNRGSVDPASWTSRPAGPAPGTAAAGMSAPGMAAESSPGTARTGAVQTPASQASAPESASGTTSSGATSSGATASVSTSMPTSGAGSGGTAATVPLGDAATGPGQGSGASATDTPASSGSVAGATDDATTSGESASNTAADVPGSTRTPPSWDPLGAAPFAWDLPEPAPATPPPPPERPANHRVTPITLALAVITAGACVLLHEISPWFGVAHTVGLVLAVLGTGLVIGSLVRGGRGLLLFAVPLGILALLFTMSHIGRDARHLGGVLGDQSYAPVSAQAVRPSYDSGAGDLTVDLRGLPAGGEPVHTAIRVGLGDARVLVPPNADVDAHCSTGIGDVDCLGLRSTGHSNGIDAHDPGLPGGSTITLDVTAGSGNVEVTRG